MMSNLVVGFKAATLEDELCFLLKLEFLKRKFYHVKGEKKNLQPLKHNANAFFPF